MYTALELAVVFYQTKFVNMQETDKDNKPTDTDDLK